MAGLSDYIKEIKRQRDLLQVAATFDDACLSENPPDFGNGGHGRRHWTRQDRRRLDYESECSQWEDSGCNGEPPEPVGRIDTRVYRICRKFSDIEPLRIRAFTDAQRQGTLSGVAPLLVAATEAHNKLLCCFGFGKAATDSFGYEEFDGESLDRCDVDRSHMNAIRKLEAYVLGKQAAEVDEGNNLGAGIDNALNKTQSTDDDATWIGPKSPSDWAKEIGISINTFATHRKNGKIPSKSDTTKLVYVCREYIERLSKPKK